MSHTLSSFAILKLAQVHKTRPPPWSSMSDPALRQAGRLLLTVGILSLVVGIVGYNLTTPSTKAGFGVEAVLAIGVLFLLLGAIAWALGRIRSTIAEDQFNAGLRRIGFLLFVVGVLGAIAGIIGEGLTQFETSPQIGIGTIVMAGVYLAIIGAIIVALSHRKIAHRA
jgi:uncharacterized membrane protein